MKCLACGLDGADWVGLLKWLPTDTIVKLCQTDEAGNRVQVKLPFHKDCYAEQFKQEVADLAEIEEPLNRCKFMVRESGMLGWYERDGKRYPELLDMHLNGRDGLPEAFIDWLKLNGFWADWWQPRERKH